MLRTRILGTPDGEDEFFDEMRWSKSTKTKTRESDQSREKERFFFICRDKNFS